jgi:hypothetical protein
MIRNARAPELGRKKELMDADLRNAAAIAEKIAPYRYARLSAVKLAGDHNNPLRVWDDASADELREEIMRRLGELLSAGYLDLKALPTPKLSNGELNRALLYFGCAK